MIYLDNSATTQVVKEAADRAHWAMTEEYYNPSGAYNAAARTEKLVETARATIAQTIGAQPNELVFTSGATESNNMAIFGALKSVRGHKRVITTAIEHPSVYEVVRYLSADPDVETVFLPCDSQGFVRMEALNDALTEDTVLVSCMQVNNEVGSIQNLDALISLTRSLAPKALIHCDGVQGYEKLDTPFPKVDLYSASGHKFHAPKGVGFLYIRNGIRFGGGQIGGGQERGVRSGTLNVPGILAMETAVQVYEANKQAWHLQLKKVKHRLYEDLMNISEVYLNGPEVDVGAPHILNLSFMGVRGEVLLHALAQKDILVATGSACSSHKAGNNRILNAMEIRGARQEGAIRFSFSPFNTVEEMDAAAKAIKEQVQMLRHFKRR